MSSLLEQLENNENILLMYLADELPPQDREEVEHLLAHDPSIRAELAEIQATQDACFSHLQKADQATLLPISSDVAARQISRTLGQWQVRRLAQASKIAPAPPGLRYPWWVYPTAAAAAVIFAAFVWWGNLPADTERMNVQTAISSSLYLNNEDTDATEANQIAVGLQQSFDVADQWQQESSRVSSIDQAHEQLFALMQKNSGSEVDLFEDAEQ